MMITENNCEEYFLLYVDNELSEAERNIVETFIQQHPKYAGTLDMLLQTKLSGNETIPFTNKTSLFKKAGSEIDITNYENYFLFYTDNELTAEDKSGTERFVLQHPQLQHEFTLLQQTKLPRDIIKFTDKQKLLKTETRRRVLPMYLTRLSVAAAIFLAIALSWLLLPGNKNTDSISVVAIKNSTISDKQIVKPLQKNLLPDNNKTITQQTIAQKIISHKTDDKKLFTTKKIVEKKHLQNDIVISLPESPDKPVAPPTEKNELKELIQRAKTESTKTVAALKPLEEVSLEEMNAQTTLSLSDDENAAQPAVYKELNTDEDNHTLYVGSFQLNKAKVNGILKSASRLLGSKQKQNAE